MEKRGDLSIIDVRLTTGQIAQVAREGDHVVIDVTNEPCGVTLTLSVADAGALAVALVAVAMENRGRW